MFSIDTNKTIHITRGDIGVIEISCEEEVGFQQGDLIRLRVFVKKKHDNVVLVKDVVIEQKSVTVDINLYASDTKIGEIINKPTDYWYEIELNPETDPQTLIGYDKDGPKIFRLYPEGGDKV